MYISIQYEYIGLCDANEKLIEFAAGLDTQGIAKYTVYTIYRLMHC
jgi:hypothetical protein